MVSVVGSSKELAKVFVQNLQLAVLVYHPGKKWRSIVESV